MKKLLLVFAVASLFFVGCQKEDDMIPPPDPVVDPIQPPDPYLGSIPPPDPIVIPIPPPDPVIGDFSKK